jgi:hypothetical protein
MLDAQQQLEFSETVISAYGKLLATMEPSLYGLPLSKLPYTVTEIKDAIHSLLNVLDTQDANITNSLTNAYMILAQFIPDDEITTVEDAMLSLNNTNKASSDTENIEQAGFITSKIKLRMENNLEEIQLFLSEKISLKR